MTTFRNQIREQIERGGGSISVELVAGMLATEHSRRIAYLATDPRSFVDEARRRLDAMDDLERAEDGSYRFRQEPPHD